MDMLEKYYRTNKKLTPKIRLVVGVEKWEDKKYFNFSLFRLVGSGKVDEWKK